MKNSSLLSMAKILKAVSNLKRLEILFLLREGELSVGELQDLVKLSQSALSQHLAILREENIVKTRRKAQTIFYSIHEPKILKILDFLESIFD